MNKKHLLNALLIFALIIMGTASAQAFSASKYAQKSKLSTGRWVKIAVNDNGIYQLTFDELAKMGFSNPQNVRIYGTGGHPMSEILDGSAIDDIKQVPSKIFGDKLCFYGCGPVSYTLKVNAGSVAQYTREINSYSQAGYYFITSDDGSTRTEPMVINHGINGNNLRASSLDYLHHENEFISPSQSGKDMLGEIIENSSINIDYTLDNLCGDSVIVVNPCVATKASNYTYVTMQVNGNNVPFNSNDARIYSASSQYVFYNSAAPTAQHGGSDSGITIPASGTFNIGLNMPTTTARWSRLDYLLVTYYHNNDINEAVDNQMRMAFTNITTSDILAIGKASESVQLWNIDNPQSPKSYTLTTKGEYRGFTPSTEASTAQFIAFDPSKQLKSIAGYEEIANQNIHGLETPHMVIITCEELIPQAERIAQMHRDNDGMTVHVLDQQKIFNEFSSGTPDAMAIRLMNKMFYDRDNNKFKYALMFGAGTYDNRQLLTKRDCTILTYESNVSNDENNSYVNDDFFGFLEDNSGKNPAADYMVLAMGRIPSASLQEAQSDVDKLLNYVNSPDYGPWRDNALYVADHYSEDGNLHAYQAEGILNVINDELNINLMKNKVYVSQFAVDPVTGCSLEGRRSLNNQLNKGQYFMTYVGHANPNTLSKEVYLWTASEASEASNQHLPIVTTACCDVARYDGNQRGLMETMFHNPNGGAIAMVASSRSAYANGNNALNQAFVKAAFSYNSTGHMPTLGEAYMQCKQSFGRVTNYNKMMFVLLGDPAMKLNYPKPLFKVTKVNGQTAGSSNISTGQLQYVTVEAKVYKSDGVTVDQSFNGNATLTILDYQKKEFTESGRDVFYPRQVLAQVDGRVVNGTFIAKTLMPRYTQSPNSAGSLAVYAHRDNSDEMVSGSFDKIVIGTYNANSSLTVNDNTAPVIEAMFFNDEDAFRVCNTVATGSMLHIRATDDFGFNNQQAAIGNSMELKIDGGKISIDNVRAYATMSNESKMLNVDIPVELDPGTHSLLYTVYDAAGNKTTQSMNFAVSDSPELTLTVEQQPAIDMATFNVETAMENIPEIHIKVLNHVGSLLWQTTTSQFPLNWDLKTVKGKKLPAGVYNFYGKYNNGTVYGGTAIGTLVVADEAKH